MKIRDIKLRIIFNSFGEKTVEATINRRYSASSPSGTSKSKYRASEIDVVQGIKNFNKIKKKFLGEFSQESLDQRLKEHISMLGSSVTTAISLAFFLATFKPKKVKIPKLLGNVLGGGSFALSKRCKIEIQEILTIPKSKNIFKSIETNFLIWREIGERLKRKNKLLGMNVESAWLAELTNEEALALTYDIAKKYDANLGIDFAASHIFKGNRYVYHDKSLSKEEQIEYVRKLIKDFKLVYVEDPLHQGDFDGFSRLKKKVNSIICGDDLIATHPERLRKAIKSKAVNGVIVKPNQAGNMSDVLKVFQIAEENKINTVVSHRSKETCCTAITRLSLISDFVKFGVAGIRVCKLNELIRLWDKTKKPRVRK